MNIAVAGGIRYFGRSLISKLLQQGHSVTVFMRSPHKVTRIAKTLQSRLFNLRHLFCQQTPLGILPLKEQLHFFVFV